MSAKIRFHFKIHQFHLILVLLLAGSAGVGYSFADNQQDYSGVVVINEIHYDPDIRTELVEYIELYNSGSEEIDIAGWYLCDGISYEFPDGSILP
ncbi:MAG: lamin tail domain-containing protein, partial [Sedimentisphaerales bacterium]|nr:lamin tail domain-containing protein [Sedimentisphaerales bacterium]